MSETIDTADKARALGVRTRSEVGLRRVVLATLCCLGVGLHCSWTASNGPTGLAEGRQSRMNPLEAQRALRVKDWKVEEDRSLPKADRRPPFHILWVSIGDFDSLGTRGELRLCFFNDRLVETWFYASDIGTYKSSLERIRGIHFDALGEARLSPATQVWIAQDKATAVARSYVGWCDIGLAQERTDWISKYS